MTPQASLDQYRVQQAIAGTTASSVLKLWRSLGVDFSYQWHLVRPHVLGAVQAGRAASVRRALPYTAAVLAETGQVAPSVGELIPERFTRDAPDGRVLDSLLDEAPIRAKALVGSGVAASTALQQAGSWLVGTTLTVLADTRRQVYHADIIQRPKLTGYTRMLNPPSCSRCVVLAGKWFGWNRGFQRHPRCDCIHIPAAESVAADLLVDPREYFDSLTLEMQDRAFGRVNARAIRDGADVGTVVNVSNRGLGTAKGRLRRGTPSRMTVDDIYRAAGTRTNAIRLLSQEGYIRLPATGG